MAVVGRAAPGTGAEPPPSDDRRPEVVLRRLPRTVKYIAYRVKPRRYRAVCVEFSLVSESSTSLEDALKRLDEQVSDYVCDLAEDGFPPHLVNRRLSPWEEFGLHLRLAGLGVAGLVGSLFPTARLNDERADWQKPLPACP